MARTKFITVTLLALAFWFAACAPSPLYIGSNHVGTLGDVARDERGEPRLSTIRAAPGTTPPPPMAPAAGNPIVPPNN